MTQLVVFTPNLQMHVACPAAKTQHGRTLREVLDTVFSGNPAARGYVLDDQGAVRRHIVIFVGGKPAKDREKLSDTVPDDAQVHIFQALSGG